MVQGSIGILGSRLTTTDIYNNHLGHAQLVPIQVEEAHFTNTDTYIHTYSIPFLFCSVIDYLGNIELVPVQVEAGALDPDFGVGGGEVAGFFQHLFSCVYVCMCTVW
jgi:hypothetical protein